MIGVAGGVGGVAEEDDEGAEGKMMPGSEEESERCSAIAGI